MTKSAKKNSVLIIEAEKKILQEIETHIKAEGFNTFTADSGDQALEIIKKENPEIIISELMVKEMNGLVLLDNIKNALPNIQIIFTTSIGEADTAISALQKGALDYIKKPIDFKQLSIALGRANEKANEYGHNQPYPVILLAEDNDSARNLLVEIIEKEDLTIFAAEDGAKAVELFKDNKIDVVLLDIKMPNKNGIQALHEMRKITHDFEAIFITGFGDENDAIQAMRDGAMSFIKKPVDLDQLFVTIDKAFEKLNLSRALKYRLREIELANEIIARKN